MNALSSTGWAALVIWPLLASAAAAIPATPLMSVYRFNGPLEVPVYDVDEFARSGPSASPAGTVAQGTAVIPCLVIRNGRPLTDDQGTPYVGFEIAVDAEGATPAATARFSELARQRAALSVANHHCPEGTARVINVRYLSASQLPPRFDPPRSDTAAAGRAHGERDEIVRAFHASPQCETANRRLIGRREALSEAWDAFSAERRSRWPPRALEQARQLDYAMRTALYEGHLDRGCSAYGACERNVIALSIRNRAVERCLRGQGCRSSGDVEGVASAVAQYNIWDEYLTQTSGLTACFLRPDLAGHERYGRVQAMYAQSVGDVERILFGSPRALQAVFPGTSADDLTRLRHYYHPPAMAKCFPPGERLEYITGAVAERGGQFALIAATWIRVDEPSDTGYHFRQAIIDAGSSGDVVRAEDRYPGFVIDGRKVQFGRSSRCAPYGTPRGCRFTQIGRHRTTPGWLSSGDPLQLTCRVRARGTDCRAEATVETVKLGGACDTQMQPVAGVR
jgi:hypothetical protein